MDFNNISKMCAWERKKAFYLIEKAEDLGINLEGYGELAVNQNSGYTYLWLEDHNFCLYMTVNCVLTNNDVYVMWINYDTGEEIDRSLSEFNSLSDIEEWVSTLEKDNRP